MTSRLHALVFLFAAPVLADGSATQWIGPVDPTATAGRFYRTFSLPDAVTAARLQFAADFCAARVTLNGREALRVEPYSPTQSLDVTPLVRRGENEIVVEMERSFGPAAVAATLTVAKRDGSTFTIASENGWQGAKSLGPVPPELWGVGRRDISLSPAENYEQWRQANGTGQSPRFWTAPGFEVTEVRVAQPDEGSWIAMALDDAGRITISREDRGLIRLTLDEARRSVRRVESIPVELEECRGLLYDRGWLFANANNTRGLYRLRIDDDGRVSDLHQLRTFGGGVGHGRNDLAVGPDGRLFAIHGDSVLPPESAFTDLTSPLRESRLLRRRREAYVLRYPTTAELATAIDPPCELFCTGLRNPYGIASHPNGDLFTYDADNEFDMGTPWYRPTRIVQLVSGADYGYRDANGEWPPNFPDRPDHAVPLLHIGRGSPTSVMFGTRLAFPPPYREALFVLDWSYGRVLAIHLAPRGSGYRAASELFLQGKPLNVTDIAAGPDGAMYLTTGGRKTQSALYRIAFTRATPSPTALGEHERAAAEFSRRQRDTRLRIETFHGRVDARALDAVWPFLTDADPQLRHAARVAVEQQPLATWQARAAQTAGLETHLALVRTGKPDVIEPLVDKWLRLPFAELRLGDQFRLLRLYEWARQFTPAIVTAKRTEIARQLRTANLTVVTPSFAPEGSADELRRRRAIFLGELGVPDAVDLAAESLLTSPLQEDRLAGLLATRHAREGWTPERRRLYFETLGESAHFVGGQGMDSFVGKLRQEGLATLSPAERESLADVLQPKTVAESLPPPRSPVRKWKLDELADATQGGDARRGATVYREALCVRCHRVGARGPAVGPDLTFVARRFSRRDILESILSPSLSVAENYRNTIVVTESGKVHVGRVLTEGDFRSETLKLNTDPLRPEQVLEINKRDVAEFRTSDTSPMPQGLLDGFTREEIRDLLAFLESGVSG